MKKPLLLVVIFLSLVTSSFGALDVSSVEVDTAPVETVGFLMIVFLVFLYIMRRASQIMSMDP